MLHWSNRKFNLIDIYLEINPNVIPLNSHGVKQADSLKVFGYTTHKLNTNDEIHDGIAILVKNNIVHKIKDDFTTEILQITIKTTNGSNNIVTIYFYHHDHTYPYQTSKLLLQTHYSHISWGILTQDTQSREAPTAKQHETDSYFS